jgi:hypothetical protein
MPRYYFRLVKADEVVKMPHGMDLPGNAAAREAALAFARDLKVGKVMSHRRWDGWRVAIVDQHGHPVDSVPVELVPPEPQLPG